MVSKEGQGEICKETMLLHKLGDLGKGQTGADDFLFKQLKDGKNVAADGSMYVVGGSGSA